jgi:hypothetical protein
MGLLGYVSGQIEREERLLEQLSKATFVLQADSLGLAERVGVTAEDVSRSRDQVSAFAARLVAALARNDVDPTVAPIVKRILQSPMPVSDWSQDLRALAKATGTPGRFPDQVLATLSSIVRFIDVGFTEELYRLYGRR